MSKQQTTVTHCDKCGVKINPENGSGGFTYFRDFEEEDGGFYERSYTDLCYKCIEPIIVPMDEFIKKWEKNNA